MRRALTRLVAALVVLTGVAATPAASEPGHDRVAIPVDHGWRFHLGDLPGPEQPAFDDSGWQRVTLPHMWNGRDGEDGGSYYRGIGWYRTVLRVPDTDRVFLQFDGANLVTFVTTVTDGVLDLEFAPLLGDAVVSAISVEGNQQ